MSSPSPPSRFARRLLPAVALCLALPAPAAAEVSADRLKPCFISLAPGRTEPVPVSARGFDPGAEVAIRIDRGSRSVARADAAGRLQGTLPAPYRARGERRLRITLTQRGQRSNRVTLRSRVSALAVSIRPRRARPDRQVRWVGRGFTAPGPVHVHYVKGGENRRSIRLADPSGPCGRFSVRRRQFPFAPSVGRWTVQIDQQPTFAQPPDSPFVQLPISVRRTTG